MGKEMTITEFKIQKQKMCDTVLDCEACPLHKATVEKGFDCCNNYVGWYLQDATDIVNEWFEKRVTKTRCSDKLTETERTVLEKIGRGYIVKRPSGLMFHFGNKPKRLVHTRMKSNGVVRCEIDWVVPLEDNDVHIIPRELHFMGIDMEVDFDEFQFPMVHNGDDEPWLVSDLLKL